jgi:hypothetical protein
MQVFPIYSVIRASAAPYMPQVLKMNETKHTLITLVGGFAGERRSTGLGGVRHDRQTRGRCGTEGARDHTIR